MNNTHYVLSVGVSYLMKSSPGSEVPKMADAYRIVESVDTGRRGKTLLHNHTGPTSLVECAEINEAMRVTFQMGIFGSFGRSKMVGASTQTHAWRYS